MDKKATEEDTVTDLKSKSLTNQKLLSNNTRTTKSTTYPKNAKPTETTPLTVPASANTKESVKAQLQDQIKSLCIRPLNQCSVNADLPRLGKKHEIIDCDSNTVFPPPKFSSGKTDFEVIKLLFKAIAQQLGDNSLTAFNNTFDLHFALFGGDAAAKNVDLTKTVDEYLYDTLTENQPIVKLLKASCSQGIVSPAWVYIRLTIFKDFPFKDVKQGWQVFVVFSKEDVTVIHRKQERSQDSFFSFCWELKIVFDRNISFLSADYAITHLQIEKEMAEPEKEKLGQLLTNWRADTFLPERPIQLISENGYHKAHQEDLMQLKDEVLHMKRELKEKNEIIAIMAKEMALMKIENENFHKAHIENERGYNGNDPEIQQLFIPYNMSLEAIFVMTKSGIIIFCNNAMVQTTNRPLEDLCGKNVSTLLPYKSVVPVQGGILSGVDGTLISVKPFAPSCNHYLVCKLLRWPDKSREGDLIMDEKELLSHFW